MRARSTFRFSPSKVSGSVTTNWISSSMSLRKAVSVNDWRSPMRWR